MPSPQFRYFLCTIPARAWDPPVNLPSGIAYIKGQKEVGEGGYEHWQLLVAFTRKVTLSKAKKSFCGQAHLEPSRSSAADDYVWKDETSVEGTRFELGEKMLKRNSKADWSLIKSKAKLGQFDEIQEDIFIRYYSTLRRISIDYGCNIQRGEQVVNVFYGPSGTGKSHRAFEEAGEDVYIKNPLNKWWDGYRGQSTVIIDEFRGIIDIAHILRWWDKYPCSVEVKGSSVFLNTKTWYITSNLGAAQWYPDLDGDTRLALMRRITNYVHMAIFYS